ncbi:MAG: transposase [Planctomycetales bacterium]
MSHKRYGAEKKAQIVRRHLADKVAVSDLADQHGVPRHCELGGLSFNS